MSEGETFGMNRTAARLAAAVGVEGAELIIRRWGGERFYVPIPGGTGRHPMAELGAEVAHRLSEAFGGTVMEVPTRLFCSKTRILAHPDVPARQLARELGVPYGYVNMVRRNHRVDA